MDSEQYDLVVIGSGPAGEKGAAQAAYFGKKVALIEREPVVGGTAANTGTLPSKTLRETALFLSGYRNRDLSGLNVSFKHDVTIRDFMRHEHAVTARERLRIHENLVRHKIEFIEGSASFVDPHTVAVAHSDGTTRYLRGETILIAVGSVPHRPPMYPFGDPRIHDSDEILTIQQLPASMGSSSTSTTRLPGSTPARRSRSGSSRGRSCSPGRSWSRRGVMGISRGWAWIARGSRLTRGGRSRSTTITRRASRMFTPPAT
jgi:hypothetical protein